MRIYTGVTVDTEDANLTALGYSGTINDKQFAALRAEGLLGALPDMFKQFDGDLAGSPTAYTARFGVGADQASGTGAFDTSLYTGSTPANGTYGNFSVTSGVITPNGSQTAGTYDVGGWPVEVISGYRAVANQTQWDALTAAGISGKTVLVREAAGITCATTWNPLEDFGWATILGDGDDPRLDTSSGRDSRKHFVKWETNNSRRLILDKLRIVTGSVAGAKVVGVLITGTGGNYVEDVHVVRSAVIASRPDPFGDYSLGVNSFPGDAGIYFAGNGRRISIRDNYVVGGATNAAAVYTLGVEQWCEVVGNWIDMCYNDFIKMPPAPSILAGNLITRPLSADTDASGFHNDGVQYQGAQGIVEANAFVKGACRGQWQSFWSADGENQITVRNCLDAGNDLYQISFADPNGCQVSNCTWLPKSGVSFPLSNPQGGLRFYLRFAGSLLGTNDILNSVFRRTSSSIEAGVTETGNVDAQSWVEADWDTNYPNWEITGLPTLQNAIQLHAAPASGGAAAGKGANQGITSWGSERSSYVLNVTTPTVSSISITPAADGFTGTLQTDVGNNPVFYCVIPQAQGNPTYREIKERRVTNGLAYGIAWCSRTNAGTNLAISGTGLTASTAYKLVAVAENGWSVQSAVTTANFTTTAAGITRIGVGAMASSDSTTSLAMTLPTGLSNGDYLVAIVSHRHSNSEPTTPSGWTLIGDGVGFTSGTPAIAVYGRVRDGTEGATLTVTTAALGRMQGFIAAYRSVSADGNEATNNSSTTTRATPTLTATANSCILHIWAAELYGETVTLPNAGDLVASGRTPDLFWFLGAENLLSTSAGTTGARTATATGTVVWNAMQVELLD